MKSIIYDIGSNNGDDIPYYLMKSDLVVAVEANPVLCQSIRIKFQAEIKQGRLTVENTVVTAEEISGDVYFYLHKNNHVLSQYPKPPADQLESFEKVMLPSRSVTSIIDEYGLPYYIKIDIEHYDSHILRALFNNNVRPPFISAESHEIEVFALLVKLGNYTAFKLVNGYTVSQVYSSRMIQCRDENVLYSFPHHSAGPFGTLMGYG